MVITSLNYIGMKNILGNFVDNAGGCKEVIIFSQNNSYLFAILQPCLIMGYQIVWYCKFSLNNSHLQVFIFSFATKMHPV